MVGEMVKTVNPKKIGTITDKLSQETTTGFEKGDILKRKQIRTAILQNLTSEQMDQLHKQMKFLKWTAKFNKDSVTNIKKEHLGQMANYLSCLLNDAKVFINDKSAVNEQAVENTFSELIKGIPIAEFERDKDKNKIDLSAIKYKHM